VICQITSQWTWSKTVLQTKIGWMVREISGYRIFSNISRPLLVVASNISRTQNKSMQNFTVFRQNSTKNGENISQISIWKSRSRPLIKPPPCIISVRKFLFRKLEVATCIGRNTVYFSNFSLNSAMKIWYSGGPQSTAYLSIYWLTKK